jgi:cell division protein FtsQ
VAAVSALGSRRVLRGAARVVRPLGARGVTLPRPRRRVWVGLALVLVLLGGGYLWLRDSSLVAVHSVRITGNAGPDQPQIARALRAAARGMTTLDVHEDALRTAVAPYPVVKDLQITTNFPHGLRIRVIEQIPVGALAADGRTIAVSADGTLLRDAPTSGLPVIPVRVPPGGTRVSDASGRGAVAALGAAPYAMLARISQVTTVSGRGVVADVRAGPQIVFGDASQMAAKWRAAAAVMADSGSAGAQYIDVTDPARPAAGASLSSGGSATTVGSAAASAAGVTAGAAQGVGAAGTTSGGG